MGMIQNRGLESIAVKVELFGIAYLNTGIKEITVELPKRVHFSQIVSTLGEECPDLIGSVISPDLVGLVGGHILNRSGVEFVDDGWIELEPRDSLLLFSNQAGG